MAPALFLFFYLKHMDMKLAKILESGLTGAATLTLLQETIDHLDPDGQEKRYNILAKRKRSNIFSPCLNSR